MTTLKMESASVGWGFWLQWWLASAAGYLVGGMLAVPIGYGLGEAVQPALGELAGYGVTGILFGIFLGGGLGIAQWLVLRSQLERAGRWALATTLGAMIGFTAIFAALGSLGWIQTIPQGMAALLAGASLGLATGLGQWWVLRRYTGQAGWWLPASLIGLTFSLLATILLGGEGRELVALGSGGLLAGPLTGAVMVWLLRGGSL